VGNGGYSLAIIGKPPIYAEINYSFKGSPIQRLIFADFLSVRLIE
jgi:hypothetical protein